MKRCVALLLVFFVTLVSGCSGFSESSNEGLRIREKLLQSSGCTFSAAVTADYGDRLYSYCADCSVDALGNLDFSITSPDTIRGITGRITQSEAALTFSDTILAFPPLADGEVSPVMAPWLFIHTLRSGYLTACGEDGDGYRLLLDDSYSEEALQLEVYLNNSKQPEFCDILWQGRRVLSLKISNFEYV